MVIDDFRAYIHNLHDVGVNQKYNGLPYSTHLKFVEAQCNRFLHLIDEGDRVAEIVYLCSDHKGKTREERRPVQYYEALANNELVSM